MRWWNRFWFEDSSLYNPLALLRIVAVLIWFDSMGGLFWFMEDALTLPDGFGARVHGLGLLGLPFPLSAEYYRPLRYGLYLASACGLVGFLTRPALVVLGLTTLYLNAGLASLNFFDHEIVLSVYVFIILALAPGTTQLSVDWLIRWWLSGRRRPLREGASLMVGKTWGMKLILCVFVVVYGAAGVSKLRYSDFRWLNGETLSFYLSQTDDKQVFFGRRAELEPRLEHGRVPLVDHAYGSAAHPPAQTLAKSPALMIAVSWATILLELAAPLLLCGSAIRIPFILSFMAMHFCIGHLMGPVIGFLQYRMYLACIIDWPWVWRLFRRWRDGRLRSAPA